MALLWMGFPSGAFGQSGGRDLYLAKCSACHGSDGAGNNTIGRSMKLTDVRPAIRQMRDEQLRELILHGQGKMPSNKKLGEEKLRNLTAFLRDLAAGNPEAGRAVAEAQAQPLPDVGRVFHDKCSACHGPDGVGQTTIGRGLKIPNLTSAVVQIRSTGELIQAISAGRGSMPGYANQFNPVQIRQLVSYLRAFTKSENLVRPAEPGESMPRVVQAPPTPSIEATVQRVTATSIPSVPFNRATADSPKSVENKTANHPVKKGLLNAEQLYVAKCSTCHSRDGSGTGTVGKSLRIPSLASRQVQQHSDETLTQAINNGAGKMPSYKRKFSTEQIQMLVTYIREFGTNH